MWLFGTCFPTSQSHFSPTNGVVRIDASGFDRTRGSKYDTKRAKLAIQQLKSETVIFTDRFSISLTNRFTRYGGENKARIKSILRDCEDADACSQTRHSRVRYAPAAHKTYSDEVMLDMFASICANNGSAHSEAEYGWLTDDDLICDDSTFLRAIKKIATPEASDGQLTFEGFRG